MEKIVNKEFNNRKRIVKRSLDKIVNVFRSLVGGELNSEYDGPVNEEKINEFENVLRDLKEQEKSYLERMRADGQLDQVHAMEVKSKNNNVRKDIAKDITD